MPPRRASGVPREGRMSKTECGIAGSLETRIETRLKAGKNTRAERTGTIRPFGPLRMLVGPARGKAP